MQVASKRIQNLAESQTLAMAKKVRELKAQGKDIINLTLGEPDFDVPKHIQEAAINAIHDSTTHLYPPVAGTSELRAAVAQYFNKYHQLPYKTENILVSTGAKQSLINAIMALVNPGEQVIIPAPYWVSYLPMVKMAEGEPVIVQCGMEQRFKITAQQLEKAITTNTKLFIINSPSNPTGMMYSKEELAELVKILEKHPNIYIIADEIYEQIHFECEHFSIARFPSIFDRVITINGLSKAFSMTGWRVGFTAAPKWIIDLCERFQGQVTSGTSHISQRAAIAAVSSDLTPVQQMVIQFRNRRDSCYNFIKKELPNLKTLLPDGAFYLYIDVSFYFDKKTSQDVIIHNVDDFVEHLLTEAGVATVSGIAFGTTNHIRISIATSLEILTDAFNKIKTALDKWK